MIKDRLVTTRLSVKILLGNTHPVRRGCVNCTRPHRALSGFPGVIVLALCSYCRRVGANAVHVGHDVRQFSVAKVPITRMSKTSSPPPAARGSFVLRFFKAAGDGLIANLLAIAGLCVALGGYPRWVTLVLAGLALALTFAFAARVGSEILWSARPTGSFILPRAAVVIAVSVEFARVGADRPWLWLATGLLALLIVMETSVGRVARGAIPYSANLPGIQVRNKAVFSAGLVFPINSVAILVFAALVMAGAPVFWLLAVPILVAIPSAISLYDGILRIRARRVAEQRLTQVLTEYGPVFALHWDGPSGVAYQIAMWMPFLERLGKRFIVIVRNPATFDSVVAMTNFPVLLRKEPIDMDPLATPSLKAAFYVNTATKNMHFVRLAHITHIQLNHGDSDKAPSYSPVFRMFDKNFVAGQAAIDRFAAHDVHVPREAFSIVGRPQVESIRVGDGPISAVAEKTVLYAPTWAGFHTDSNYSSLRRGFDIISALLDQGCRVIFRPHPYTDRSESLAHESHRIKKLLEHDSTSSGREHLFGRRAESEMSIVECFNASDALVADVSSVVPDFLYSEKPFAMTAMLAAPAAFAEEFPIAKAAYVITSNLSNLTECVGSLLGPDPLAGVRRDLKTYYLGDFPAENYADAFLTEAGRYLE